MGLFCDVYHSWRMKSIFILQYEIQRDQKRKIKNKLLWCIVENIFIMGFDIY